MDLITFIQFVVIVGTVVYMGRNLIHLERAEPVRIALPDLPSVSVCVPARNEERDIENCLNSLLNQNYPDFEVIAVDDHSTDATGEIIRRLSQQDSRLTVISSKPLPEGWLGKPFALHQAFLKAKGKYLLFTDADLMFQPYALTSAVLWMDGRDLDVLTLMPGTKFGSFWERTVLPVIFGFIAALSRFKKIGSADNSSAMGFGAFLMFKRKAYEELGGHESVKQEVLEDVFLAKNAKRAGFRLGVADGKTIFSIRMYHSLGEIWAGWRKNMFFAMKKSVLRTLYYICAVLGFVLTPYLVAAGNIWQGTGIIWTGLSFIGLLLALVTGAALCDELKLSRWTVFLFPIGAVIMAAIMLNSMVQVCFKGQTEWRGRTYEGL